MEKIASFSINHNRLLPGLYVSRTDTFDGATLTTFDMRFKRPNIEPPIDMAALHTMEHLCATYLRNHKVWGPKIVYFGPMGCRTGNYVVMHGKLAPQDVLPVMIEMCGWLLDYEGEVPGAAPMDCGNYREHNLVTCKWEIRLWKQVLETAKPENLVYPPREE